MDLINSSYLLEIKQILSNARQKAYTAVNSAMVEPIGKLANVLCWKNKMELIGRLMGKRL